MQSLTGAHLFYLTQHSRNLATVAQLVPPSQFYLGDGAPKNFFQRLMGHRRHAVVRVFERQLASDRIGYGDAKRCRPLLPQSPPLGESSNAIASSAPTPSSSSTAR